MAELVVGCAESAVGKLPGRSSMSLATEVSIAAVTDAGISLADLDGIAASQPLVGGLPRHALSIGEQLGISGQLTYADTHNLGGASLLVGFLRACERVRAGQNRAVLVVGADTARTGQQRNDSVAAIAAMRQPDWEQPFGMSNVSAYALLAERYLTRYRLDRSALASIPVALRAYARTNPGAVYRDALSKADVVASRMVASPLRLLECSPISDGAGALVVHNLGGTDGLAISLLGGSEGYRYDNVSFAEGLDQTGAALSAGRAFQQSGLGRTDVDVAMVYDSYSITLAMELEQIGFFAPGTSPAAIEDGAIGLDGIIPTNTHGGLLSHSHAGGAAGSHHIIEAIRQLAGTAHNQVPDARVALVHAEGGIISANCTVLLGTGK